MRAIEFQLDATKLLQVRFGESSFKPIDEFWTDFKPDGGEKTTTFLPCICKDTENNRKVVTEIRAQYVELKSYTDMKEKGVLWLRNKLEK